VRSDILNTPIIQREGRGNGSTGSVGASPLWVRGKQNLSATHRTGFTQVARHSRAVVKFADADPIGYPARVTVSKRSLKAGSVELKARWAQEWLVVTPEGPGE